MNIKHLFLKNYRNYGEYEVEINDGLNIVIGRNAVGKTNLLEAIHFLESGKSHKTNVYQELIKWNENFSAIKARVQKSDRELLIEATLSREAGKRIKINGVEIKKIHTKVKPLIAVIFTPDHLKIVKETPEHRRAFMDEILEKVKPDYSYWRQQYLKVLKQRNLLLKKVKINQMKDDIITYWDKQLVNSGARIIFARKGIIKKIEGYASDSYKKITNEDIKLTLHYENQLLKEDITIQELEDSFMSELAKKRRIEIERGQTIIGPHRDDIGIYIDGIDNRVYGSQGEQRSVSLALKMAELLIINEITNDKPILLLDDVMSELDYKRREYFLKQIDFGVQIIITSTSAGYLEDMDISDANIIGIT